MMSITNVFATPRSPHSSTAMRATYAELVLLSDAHRGADRSPTMPLLGFFTGLTLATALWTAIGWIAWALLA